MNPEREQKVNEFYVGLEPVISTWKQLIKKDPVMLDAGSGEGVLALKIAETINARRIILTDRVNILSVPLPPHAEFRRIDICTKGFLGAFHHRVDVVVSTFAFHEFSHPLRGITNLFCVLPEMCLCMLFDYSEEGWIRQRQLAEAKGDTAHYERDIRNIRSIRVDTNARIREFWERQIFPKFPGQTNLCFYTGVYAVVYRALSWGKVKPIPPELVRSVFARLR